MRGSTVKSFSGILTRCEPLVKFVRSNGLPAGTFALEQFRWKDRSFLDLLMNPEKYNADVIGRMLKQSPKRKSILIGDATERNSEIYRNLGRKFPT